MEPVDVIGIYVEHGRISGGGSGRNDGRDAHLAAHLDYDITPVAPYLHRMLGAAGRAFDRSSFYQESDWRVVLAVSVESRTCRDIGIDRAFASGEYCRTPAAVNVSRVRWFNGFFVGRFGDVPRSVLNSSDGDGWKQFLCGNDARRANDCGR